MKQPAVALLIETSNAYARGILEGIIAYNRDHEPWLIDLPEQGRGALPPDWVKRWRGDGIIARIENPQIAAAVVAADRPFVDVSAARQVPNAPWVETDDGSIARLAAEHLLERGFRRLAFFGDARFNWSRWRHEAFAKIAREHDCEFFEYEVGARKRRRRSGSGSGRDELVEWVDRLPKPIGVMACYDIAAQRLLDACRGAGVAVPEELAVIGVDNDQLLCNLSNPPLTSIVPNARRAGYEAAALLARLMRGEHVPPEAHLIAPLGISVRQSTDVLAIDDADVVAALRFIRENACRGIHVEHVLKEVALSRRALESRFSKLLGRTPHEEIQRLRLERVKQLLLETDLNLDTIATRCGFNHVEYMSVAFKKALGLPPGAYRRANQHGR